MGKERRSLWMDKNGKIKDREKKRGGVVQPLFHCLGGKYESEQNTFA